MIQMYTILDVADNTGAKECMCIKVLGGTRRRYAGLGDVITASVKEAAPESQIKKGKVVRFEPVGARGLVQAVDDLLDKGRQKGVLGEFAQGEL